MVFWRKDSSKTGLADIRARYDALFARFGPVPQVDFTPGQLGPVAGEWVGAGERTRTMLYFHGGGFVAGTPQTHRPLIGRLVEASGVGAFSVNYRLAPDCAFPAALRDGLDAYRALLAKGVQGGQVVLAGDEAGGGLAFAVALAARNAGLAMPGGIVALSPWADLSLSGASLLANRQTDPLLDWEGLFLAARQVLRKAAPCDPYASPCWGNLKGFPPVMVHAGALEVLRDDAARLGDRCAEAGVPVSVEIYDGMGHLFQLLSPGKDAAASLTRLGRFVRAKSAVFAV
jgi:monoterpene epsilon-lactone hydrolase